MRVQKNTFALVALFLGVALPSCGSGEIDQLRASLAQAPTSPPPPSPIFGTTGGPEFFVAPSGSPSGDGSIGAPWDLQTALNQPTGVGPGATIWLRGGTYSGAFTSNLQGNSASPIVVRQAPDERATIDGGSNRSQGALAVYGHDAWFVGFEVMSSHPTRTFVGTASNVYERGGGVRAYGPRVRFIHLAVHDGTGGLDLWNGAVDAEAYGNLIYNQGVEGTDRGHGHAMYIQNKDGLKRVRDNFMFNGFSMGVHAYGSSAAYLDNMRFEGNIAFNAGVLSDQSGAKTNLLVGGGRIANNIQVVDNHFYNSPGNGGRGADLGTYSGCTNPLISGNRFFSDTAIQGDCLGVNSSSMSGNTLRGSVHGAYVGIPGNTYLPSRPTGTQVFVRPSAYVLGRANIVVYNWSGAASVSVDIAAAGLAAGQAFRVVDAQNFFGPPVYSGKYVSGATISLPMSGLPAVRPVGTDLPLIPQHTSSEFGTFVVMPSGT